MLHKIFIPFLFISSAYFLASCSAQEQNENVAGVKHFYFEFVDEVQNEITLAIIDKVSKNMVQYDYIMSEESASKGWPFYGTVGRGSEVLKTEMMPPHSNVNRFSPIGQLTNQNDGEHTLKVIYSIQSINDSTLIIAKKSYKWQNDEWLSFSQKMSTEFVIASKENQEVIEKISNTLIRYTFK